MSLPIRGIYLKEVRILLFVKMLILNFHSLSRSISANEVSLLAIIVVSLDTFGYTVLKFDIISLGIILEGVLTHAVTVVSMATPKPNASK